MIGQYRRPQTKSIRSLAVFPGALGDFLCALPALRALAPLTLVARSEVFGLLEGEAIDLVSIDRREVADLFADSALHDATRRVFAGHAPVHSWMGHGDDRFRERLAAVTGASVRVHALCGMRAGEHASEYFGRCVGRSRGPHALVPPRDAIQWASELWDDKRLGPRTLAIHAGSGSRRKNWEGMSEVADAWRRSGGRVLAVIGPAETDAPDFACDAAVAEEPLVRVAAALRRAHRYLGNDSGVSHLAGCLGIDGAVVFGPTDPMTWRPQGTTLSVVHAPAECALCKPDCFCTHRLPVETVLVGLGVRHG